MIWNWLVNIGISINMTWSRFIVRRPLIKSVKNVARTQHALLKKILRENITTAFGQEHDFKHCYAPEDFRKNVPIRNYDALAPYIERQMNGEEALTKAPPVFYARSSGTTGRYKDIPLTKRGIRQVKRAQKQLAMSLSQDTKFFKGAILGFASQAEEGHLPNGLAYGSTSGSTYKSLSPVIARKFIIPAKAFEFSDVEAKYEVYALAALSRRNITGVATANPSSLLKVTDIIHERANVLLDALITGDGRNICTETNTVLDELRANTHPRRLKKLQKKLKDNSLTPEDLWPKLSAVATWTGGSCGIALDRLIPQLPKGVKIVEYGYAASEFMGSVNVDARENTCLPLVTDHYYEFLTIDDWENEQLNFLHLHQLAPDTDYYIFITTRSGLYRYDINDIIRTGKGVGSCPAIYFVRKGRGVTNITGEKLSEDQVIAAVSSVLDDFTLKAYTYFVLADEEAACYRLYIEIRIPFNADALAQALDRDLKLRNAEYDDKRSSGRLKELEVAKLKTHAGESIKQKRLNEGVREAQYKPTILDYFNNWTDILPEILEDDQ